MKTTCCLLLALLLCVPVRAADPLGAALQKGLFEEEANRNLDAAIQAYQALIAAHENDRKLAATAVFRLGECYRKLGRTNDAIAQYRRVLDSYSDQPALVTLSRQNLTGLGAPPAPSARAGGEGPGTDPLLRQSPASRQAEAAGLSALIDRLKAMPRSELRRALPTAYPDALLQQLLASSAQIEVKLAALADSYSKDHPSVREQVSALETVNRQIEDRIDGILRGLQVMVEFDARPVEVAGATTSDAAVSSSEEDEEIRRIQSMIRNSPDLINALSGDAAPLHKAAAKGQLAVARFLLDNGALVNRINGNAQTPLALACREGHRAMAELLLSRGADPNATDGGRETPLHLAARKGFVSVAEVLIGKKSTVDARNGFNETPLHVAVANGQSGIVAPLLKRGAAVNAQRGDGDTPLHLAALRGDVAMIQELLDQGADIAAVNKKGAPPIWNAMAPSGPSSYVGRIDAVRLLLSKGASIDRVVDGESAAHLAVARNSPELLQLLIDQRARPDLRNKSGLTPLQQAVIDNMLPALIPILVKAGADPNAVTSEISQFRDLTPLIVAIGRRNLPMVECLLTNGADVNIPDQKGYTPLAHTLDQPREFLDLILRYKPDLEARPRTNSSPALHMAIHTGKGVLVDTLVKAGARVDATDNHGRTPLHVACLSGQPEIAALLLKKGANPNAYTPDGTLPLALARSESSRAAGDARRELDRLLLDHGADESLLRKGSISVTRAGRNYEAVVFRKGTNEFNRHSLFELMVNAYAHSSPKLPFPDLKRLEIRRLLPDGATRAIAIEDLDARLSRPISPIDLSCTNDVWLEWGDQVEIPEADHPLTATWGGFSWTVGSRLAHCLRRTVDIVVNGRTNRYELQAQPRSREPGKTVERFSTDSFRLREVLQYSGLVTKDMLPPVRVRRTGPGFHDEVLEFRDWGGSSDTDLWLRDGDVIEVLK